MTASEYPQPFLDTRELAAYLRVNEKQVYTLVRDRGLPGTRVTGKWLFPRHMVDRWLEAAVINPPDRAGLLDLAPGLLLVAGSDDPLLASLLSLYRRRYPETLALQSQAGSVEGVVAMKRGLCHLAAVHLPDGVGGFTTDHLDDSFGESAVAVTFAGRTQGLLLAPGNPLGIADLVEAADRDLTWALRPTGTGTRALLELELEKNGLPADCLAGGIASPGHIDTGIAVLTGAAQVGLGLESTARRLNLHFVPVADERFDLVVRRDSFFKPPVSDLLELGRGRQLARVAAQLGGYDLSATGTVIS